MKKVLLIVAAALVVLGLVGAGTVYYFTFAGNTDSFEGTRSVYVPRGASFAEVADSLEAAGLLQNRGSFETLGRTTGWAGQVKAGHYAFEAGASNYDLLDTIRKGLQTPVRLTIPPGTRPEVVAAVAARDMEFEKEAFLTALQSDSLAQALGTDTAHLFGYMLPETYNFYWLTPPATVVRRVKESFDAFWERELQAKAEQRGLTKPEVASLAAIVEWEAHQIDERPEVAAVYLNRLDIGMKLDADPTVQYVIQEQEGQKRRLLFEDYRIEHPYNTYLRRGLPPGPVTNPAPSALRAVVNAAEHDYLYFVADGEGGHVFSRTLREHNAAAQRYYQKMRERRAQAGG